MCVHVRVCVHERHSGMRPADLKPETAITLEDAQARVAELLKVRAAAEAAGYQMMVCSQGQGPPASAAAERCLPV